MDFKIQMIIAGIAGFIFISLFAAIFFFSMPIPVPYEPTTTTLYIPKSDLELGLRCFSRASFINSIMMENDTVAAVLLNLNVLNNVERGEKAYLDGSLKQINETLSGIGDVKLDYLGYEIGDRTPVEETNNSIDSVKRAQKLAKDNGLKLLVIPSLKITKKHGFEIVKYSDVYVIDARFYQVAGEFKKEVEKISNSLRASNPKAKIFVEISTLPEGNPKDGVEMYLDAHSIEDLCDGIWIDFYDTPSDIIKIRNFVRMLRG